MHQMPRFLEDCQSIPLSSPTLYSSIVSVMIVSFGSELLLHKLSATDLITGPAVFTKLRTSKSASFVTQLPPCDMELRPGTWQSTYKRIKGPQAKRLFDMKRKLRHHSS
jgi:hypothetical protein